MAEDMWLVNALHNNNNNNNNNEIHCQMIDQHWMIDLSLLFSCLKDHSEIAAAFPECALSPTESVDGSRKGEVLRMTFLGWYLCCEFHTFP